MSLISVRNFVAPLQNRLHLGTIIMVAVLIAVARLSGGAVRIGSIKKQAVTQEAVPTDTDESTDEINNSVPDKMPSKNVDRDPLDDLLAEQPAHQPEHTNKNSNNNNKPNQLSDIRKSLGLE